MSETARERATRLRNEFVRSWVFPLGELDALLAAEVEAVIEERTVPGSKGWWYNQFGDDWDRLDQGSKRFHDYAVLVRLPEEQPCDE